MLLDDVLQHWHKRERHETKVEAPPERVFAAMHEVTLAEMPIVRLLVRLRGMRPDTGRPMIGEMRKAGFKPTAEEQGREVVFAAIGQPWKARRGARPQDADFRTFHEPGYAKMAFNFRLDDTTLSTETRVFLTDERSRRAFARYWLMIRPFSGLIRRLWLQAIVRRAEA